MAEFNLPFGVYVANNEPVDKKFIAIDITSRNNLVTGNLAYKGMPVFVESEDLLYYLKGTTNTDWVVIPDKDYVDSTFVPISTYEAEKHFRGQYTSKAALDTAVPSAVTGDYANVDAGIGSDVARYIWDDSDGVWVLGGGAGTVASVNNQLPDGAGNVTIDKTHIGLSNVDNTSDLNKPISTTTQTALDGKEPTLGFTPVNKAGDTMTGNLTANSFIVNGGSFPSIIFNDGTTSRNLFTAFTSGTTAELRFRYNGTNDGTIWHSGNDGSGSGLAADLLKSGYITDLNAAWKSDITNAIKIHNYSATALNKPNSGDNANWLMCVYGNLANYGHQISAINNENIYFRHIADGVFGPWRKLWHAGNQGSGSGLDADLWDGKHRPANFGESTSGVPYEVLDLNNTLNTIGETHFYQVTSTNKPNSGDGYVTTLWGGDVANRGGQLALTRSGDIYFRLKEDLIWKQVITEDGGTINGDLNINGTLGRPLLITGGAASANDRTPILHMRTMGSSSIVQMNLSGDILEFGHGSVTDTSPSFTMDTSSGNFVASGNVTAYSDKRLKENIKVIPDALQKVLKIQGVNYNRKDDKNKTLNMGFVADDLLKVVPEVVNVPEKEEEMMSVNYQVLTALQNEAIKEQQKQIESLEERLSKLEKLL